MLTSEQFDRTRRLVEFRALNWLTRHGRLKDNSM
jgi:hypothetical protein